MKRAIATGLGLCLAVGLTAGLLKAQTPAAVPDVSGRWTGKFTAIVEGQTKEEGGYAILEQKGTAISGSVGPRADRQQPINTGTIETVKGVTTVKFDSGRPGHLLRFELTLAAGKLAGTIKDEFYPANKITAELQREK